MVSMRRKNWMFYGRWIAAALILVLAAGVLLALKAPPKAPKFRRGAVPEGPFLDLRYPFLDLVPISEGLTWVGYSPTTNSGRVFFLDVKDGSVLGELIDAEPEAIDGRSRQVFCRTVQRPRTGLMKRLFTLVAKFAPKLLPAERDEMFWVIDLHSGKARLIGHAPAPQMSTVKAPSPDFSKVYDVDQHVPPGCTIRLFNLSKGTLQRQTIPGWPLGWWSDLEILYKLDGGGIGVYNIGSKQSGAILSLEALEKWLAVNRVEIEARKVDTFPVWNGREYLFFAADTHEKWLAETSILARVEKEDRTLKMLEPSFRYGWSDHLHPDERHYVYTGRQVGDNSSAIFVRDLKEGSDRMIVPPDGAYFSIPNFYENWIVFVRSNMLWRTDLNGSNTVRLFPPVK